MLGLSKLCLASPSHSSASTINSQLHNTHLAQQSVANYQRSYCADKKPCRIQMASILPTTYLMMISEHIRCRTAMARDLLPRYGMQLARGLEAVIQTLVAIAGGLHGKIFKGVGTVSLRGRMGVLILLSRG